MNHQEVCVKCWQLKTVDGSDGLGGFTPNNRSASGWTNICRKCRAKIAKDRRNAKKEAAKTVANPVNPDCAAEDV
jgi:hypothetical protein